MRVTRHQAVSSEKRALARQLRETMTPEEDTLWNALRHNALGVRFRRQQVIAGFIVDFYCASARLAIEVDGSVHLGRQDYDLERDAVLSELGIRTLRIGNRSVVNDLREVLRRIRKATSSPAPLPLGEGRKNESPQ